MAPIEGQEEAKSCGASLEQHIVDVWTGLTLVGVGGGCETTYQAIVEFAEELRQANGFDHYVPQANGLVVRTLKTAVEKAQAEQKRKLALQPPSVKPDTLRDNDGTFIFPSNLGKN